MNTKLKKGLRATFDAPAPKRKNAFLLSLNFPKATHMAFLFAQVGYIRKRVWCITLLAVVPALIALFSSITENVLGYVWVISSLLPFIALVGITEIARSVSHNMAELEISCKYDFYHVVLARLVVLGFTNMVLFAVVITSFSMAGSIEVIRLVVYLFVPFLLTCSLSLFSLNRLRSRESIYICGGISCFISIVNAFLSNQYRNAFSYEYMTFWGVAFCILLIWTVYETINLIRRMEETQWNLSLTA